MDDETTPTFHSITDGAVAATHPPPHHLTVYAGPATNGESNTLRPIITPVACFKLENVRFDFDCSLLLPAVRDEMPFLKLLIDEQTKESAGKKLAPRLSIFGHADPTGSDDYNKSLSGRRAAVVYAMLTRRPEIWEDLYSDTAKFAATCAGDKWGLKFLQIMLNALPADPPKPCPEDGKTTPETTDALKAFQQSHGLSPSGNPDAQTRKTLFLAYMDYLCIDSAGNPFKVDPTDGFLGRNPATSDGKADFQGCSEFNPLMLFSRSDLDAYNKQSDHAERDEKNSINRRVMILLFKPCAKIDPSSWPCPKAREGDAGCRKRFWSDGEKRRANADTQREFPDTRDTFACRFYHRLVTASPCEQSVAEYLVNWITRTPPVEPAKYALVAKLGDQQSHEIAGADAQSGPGNFHTFDITPLQRSNHLHVGLKAGNETLGGRFSIHINQLAQSIASKNLQNIAESFKHVHPTVTPPDPGSLPAGVNSSAPEYQSISPKPE